MKLIELFILFKTKKKFITFKVDKKVEEALPIELVKRGKGGKK